MNYLYNIARCNYESCESNEGFGLGTCESLMVGTPIIVNVTGAGLQDQVVSKSNDKLITVQRLFRNQITTQLERVGTQ